MPISKFFFVLILLPLMIFGISCDSCGGINPFVDDYKVVDNQVYFISRLQGLGTRNTFVVKEADAKTFKNLGDGFGHDQNLAFYLGQVIPGADGASFRVIAFPYVGDKNQVYYKTTPISQDPTHFQKIGKIQFGTFAKDSAHVFFNENILPDADAATFAKLGDNYFTDKNALFYGTVRIEGSDGLSAETISGGFGDFARDQNNVYRNGLKIVGADPKTFKTIRDRYSQDKNHVYFIDKVLSDDPEHFKIFATKAHVTPRYAHDSVKVYINQRELLDADATSFKVLNYYYVKDKNHVWHDGKILEGVNAPAFTAMDDDYGKDNDTVYYKTQPIPEADAKTFRMENKPNPAFALDKNHVYWLGKIRHDKKIQDFK